MIFMPSIMLLLSFYWLFFNSIMFIFFSFVIYIALGWIILFDILYNLIGKKVNKVEIGYIVVNSVTHINVS